MIGRWLNAVRRNHGLEHATVAILFERSGPQRIAGRASGNGFFIVGKVDQTVLDECAHEALRRMQNGQPGLAVSPLCGTNIAVTGLFTAAAALGAMRRAKRQGRSDGFMSATTAAMLAVVAAQPAGRWLQQFVTTRGDVDQLSIVETKQLLPGVKKVFTRSSV
ncbi:MAG: hypothetical protein DWG79_00375 [Chloroflexi bacterium]|nr:DUF6391 domain-containing protein [Chloroflexota bacterium]MDA1146444.1 DUF6391 domain-containing protein [Chloroflexota bacterium]MQC82313.1 hypothetical protein [Chloroflexota bacterium]MQC82627.1 hypothetical protein [Chloroflexota bacterium]